MGGEVTGKKARKKSVWTRDRPDAQYRRVGRRSVIIRPDEREVLMHEDWLVCVCDDWGDANWASLKVLLMRPAKKNVFYLGWHRGDERRSHTREWDLLIEHHQAFAEWLQDCLRGDLRACLAKGDA